MKTHLTFPDSPLTSLGISKALLAKLPRKLAAELASRDLKEFVTQAWPILEPATPFVDGIHIAAMCLHLQAVTNGQIQNLIINVPPGHAKSLITAVFWPAWVWINHPEVRMLYSSNRVDLAIRDSLNCRRLIESPWYQQNWGDRYQLREDQNTRDRFENTCGGYRVVVAIGAGTGERGDYVVVDDPHTVDEAESDTQRRSVLEWWNGCMATRVNDLATGHKVVIQQRLHEMDLTGDLLQRDGYELLCLPAEFEPERRCTTSIGWTDPRTEAGELLWPQKVPRRALDGLKASLGSYRYAGQYQQRPAPAGGGIFQKSWLRFYRPANVELPPVEIPLGDGTVARIEAEPLPAQFDMTIQSWDMSFKGSDTSDYVVGQVWGVHKADRYILDQRRARLDMPGTKEAVKELKRKWPRTGAILVEDKANGPAVIQELHRDIGGLIEVTPEGGKVARAHAAAPLVESGNLYLPHPAIAPWVKDFIEEFAAFPNGRYDDQVDAMTQALNWLRNRMCRFSVPEAQITIDEMEIPDAWPRGFGMAITKYGVAALWGARDPNGTIYLYGEHLFLDTEPGRNAKAIAEWGPWIPGVLNLSALQGSQEDKMQIARIYKKLGLDVIASRAEGDAGIFKLSELLARNKLKVFSSLEQFLGEYRGAEEQSPLLLCCQSLVLSIDRMRTKPVPRPVSVSRFPQSERDWMGYGG